MLEWLGVPDVKVRATIDRYAEWLATEARAAGGIGPHETDRLLDRHLADSLSFAAGFPTGLPATVLDVGSGVGLPGIPLAIAFPGNQLVLLDRSGRRTRLLRRVVRVLKLANVDVMESDVAAVTQPCPGITMRASLPLARAVEVANRLLTAGGTAVIGLSRSGLPDARQLRAEVGAQGLDADVVEIPPHVLDSPAWLLRITRRD